MFTGLLAYLGLKTKDKENKEFVVDLIETPAGKLGATIAKSMCPDCGSTKGFYEGPRGGASTNIFCVNPKCRSGFNFTWVFGEGYADRISKGPEGYYKE